jgi:hypothetical protein
MATPAVERGTRRALAKLRTTRVPTPRPQPAETPQEAPPCPDPS